MELYRKSFMRLFFKSFKLKSFTAANFLNSYCIHILFLSFKPPHVVANLAMFYDNFLQGLYFTFALYVKKSKNKKSRKQMNVHDFLQYPCNRNTRPA